MEKDTEALISALPRKVSILTRAIFETGARCGEIWALKRMDVDFQNTMLLINKPEKNSKRSSTRSYNLQPATTQKQPEHQTHAPANRTALVAKPKQKTTTNRKQNNTAT